MARTKIAIAVVAVALIVIIAWQNSADVSATILFFSANVPLAALLLFSFVTGLIVGLLIAFALAGKRKAVTKGA